MQDSSRAITVPGYHTDGTPSPYRYFTDTGAGAGSVVLTNALLMGQAVDATGMSLLR